MLTQSQYNNLWATTLGLPITNIPCYYQYLQREVYFQDYLDLFGCPKSGKPTFERDKKMSVDLGFPINHDTTYTIQQGNQVRLIVDYDFPYGGQLCNKREIKYILIGEAPPAPSIPFLNAKGEDTTNTYFYNKNHMGSTNYFKAPIDCWGIGGKTKIDRLVGLANEKVLLLDLFPFALSYSKKVRDSLNVSGATKSFWDDISNPYSIKNRLDNINKWLDKDWDLSLMASPTISIYVVEKLNAIAIRNVQGQHPSLFDKISKNLTRYKSNKLRKITNSNYKGSLYGPTPDLIRDSFF